MAQSQVKPFSFMNDQSIKIWLPQVAAFVYLLTTLVTFLLALFHGIPLADWYIPLLVGLVFLASASWVFIVRRCQHSALVFVLFSTSFCLAVSIPLVLPGWPRFDGLWLLSLGLLGGSLFDLTLSFPSTDPYAVRYPFLRLLGYLMGVVWRCLPSLKVLLLSEVEF